MNNLPNLSDGAGRNGEIQMNGPTVELPIGTRNWSALETLAEVSRQMDLSEKHDDRSTHNGSVGGRGQGSEPPRAEKLELQEQYTLDNPPVSYEQRVQREKKSRFERHLLLQAAYLIRLAVVHYNPKNNRRGSEASLPPANFASHMNHSRSTSPNLAMAATSMAAAAAARFVPSMVDPQLLGEDANRQVSVQEKSIEQALSEANASFSDNMFDTNPSDQQLTWTMLGGSYENTFPTPDGLEQSIENTNVSRASAFPRTIAMNPSMVTEFSAEYGNGRRPNKPKVRGRFSNTRRKEVQEVRKKGACIRCRMLKKPCSGDNPCTTCKNVESARLWKAPCIRTRVADEFEMYSAGLHAVLAYHEVGRAKAQVAFQNTPHYIEASHFPETTVYATFNALEGQLLPSEGNIDPGLSGDFSVNTVRILDNDNDDLPMKLEAYMKRMSNTFFEREPSHFMHVTLSTAQELAIQKQDQLLSRVLELWAIVHILVDHELRWTISERVDIDAPAGQGPIIDQNTSDGTYGLLCLQLNAAAEKKASAICKSVLNDLERRLLQRSSTNSFETFLVAVIMLNCVEKSTWLFKSWEQESFKSRWPLDKTPIHYSSQGDKLTDMLQMLLRMRSVPPKTYTREDGVIATDAEGPREYLEKLQLNCKCFKIS